MKLPRARTRRVVAHDTSSAQRTEVPVVKLVDVTDPALPMPPENYSRSWQDHYSSVLRLFFGRLTFLTSGILDAIAGLGTRVEKLETGGVGGGKPAGNDGEIQFNDNDAFGASEHLFFNDTFDTYEGEDIEYAHHYLMVKGSDWYDPDANVEIGSNEWEGAAYVEARGGHSWLGAQTLSEGGAGMPYRWGGELWVMRGRGTLAAPADVQVGDSLGQLMFAGWRTSVATGSFFNEGVNIYGRVEELSGTWVGAGLVFGTHGSGNTNPVSRLRISYDGGVVVCTGHQTDPVGASKGAGTLNTKHLYINNIGFINELSNATGIRDGTTAQILRLYNTWTDVNNYERGKFAWESNVLRIGTEKGGTGLARPMEFIVNGVKRMALDTTGVVDFTNTPTVNGVPIGGGGLTPPAGSDREIQFNNAGVFGSSPSFGLYENDATWGTYYDLRTSAAGGGGYSVVANSNGQTWFWGEAYSSLTPGRTAGIVRSGAPYLHLSRYRGTEGAFTANNVDDLLGKIEFAGTSASMGQMRIGAHIGAEVSAVGPQLGANLVFGTAAVTDTNPQYRMRLDANGGLVLRATATTDPTGGSKGAGTVNAPGLYVNGVAVALSDVRWIDIKNSGAKGDGTTNDTAAIQAAADYLGANGGGVLFFAPGTYVVNPVTYLWLTISSNRKNYACVLLPSNVTVQGSGPASVIKLGSTLSSPGTTDGRGDFATTHMFVNKNAPGLPKTVVNQNIHVRSLKFDGNLVEQSGEGVTFCGVENFSIEDCHFTQSYYETNYFVYSRGGIYAHNHCYKNGIYQWDGGGPMIDACANVNIINNIITDSGYYAVLMIDSYDSTTAGNQIYPMTYTSSAGYQAIRVANCSQCRISDNDILDSSYSAIWVHGGRDNTVEGNTVVHAGYGSGGGSNINGITLSYNADADAGRHTASRNKVYDSAGAGIAIVEAVTSGSEVQYNAGSTISDNTVAWNQRDGIAVYGKHHRIIGNLCESNGKSETSGVAGNGYNGIVLNGATYCLIEGNTGADVLHTNPVKLNLDASNSTTVTPQRTVTHTTRTQNYGVAEYPAALSTTTVTGAGNLVWTPASAGRLRITSPAHKLVTGQWTHMTAATNSGGTTLPDFVGYFDATVIDVNTFDIFLGYDPGGASPNTIIYDALRLADYNIITGNSMVQNLANPTLGATGGYKAFGVGSMQCGANSTKMNNLGQ